jgi:SOS-response transcriptional repressor LexA
MIDTARWPVGLALSFLLVTAGCVGVLTGDEPLTFEATPVTVADAALEETGYEQSRTDTNQLNREFSAAGQTREVEVTNHIAEYARTVDAGPLGSEDLARFIVVSTPAVEIFDRTFNPVGEMSNRQLVERVQDRYEGLQNVQSQSERTVPVLGTSATVSVFSAEATVKGTEQTIDLTLHVTRVRHGDDFVIAIGAHPAVLNGEVQNVDRLLKGVRHDA